MGAFMREWKTQASKLIHLLDKEPIYLWKIDKTKGFELGVALLQLGSTYLPS